MSAGLLIFIKRKPGTTLEQFRDYYEGRHVPLCMKYMAGPTSYVRRFVSPADGQAEPEFDVVTELVFPNTAVRDGTLAAMAADAMPEDVVEDEEQFMDRTKTRFYAFDRHETALEG